MQTREKKHKEYQRNCYTCNKKIALQQQCKSDLLDPQYQLEDSINLTITITFVTANVSENDPRYKYAPYPPLENSLLTGTITSAFLFLRFSFPDFVSLQLSPAAKARELRRLPNFSLKLGSLPLPDFTGLFKFRIENDFQNRRESKGHCVQLKRY